MGSCLSQNPPNINEDEIPEPDVRTEEQKQQEQQNTQEPVSMTNVATGRARFSGYVVEDNKKTPILCHDGVLKTEDDQVYISLPINSKGWEFTIRPGGNLIGTHNLHAIVILKDGTKLSCDAEVDIADMDALRIIEDVTFELVSEETSLKKKEEQSAQEEPGSSSQEEEEQNSGDEEETAEKQTHTLEIQGSISWKIDEDELEGSERTQSRDNLVEEDNGEGDRRDTSEQAQTEGSDD